MFDLDDLRAFSEVAASGGLTAAAMRLGASKSMVSRRLSRLEGELGVQLVARTTRGAALTQAGADFALHAARILAEVDAAREAVAPTEEVAGLLRIAAPLSFGATHLSPVLAQLAARHPKLSIQTSYSDRTVDLVADGYDAAVRLGTLRDSSLIARKINGLRAGLFASPAYLARRGTPRSIAELMGHEACTFEGETWRLNDHGRWVTVRPRGRFRADAGQALAAAAVEGLGIVGLPAFLAQAGLDSGALVEVMADYPMPEAGMYIVRPPPADHMPRKVAALTEMLLEKFGPGTGCDEVG